jgi:hypothetical protein
VVLPQHGVVGVRVHHQEHGVRIQRHRRAGADLIRRRQDRKFAES